MSRKVTISTLQLPVWSEGESLAERKASVAGFAIDMLAEAGRRGSDFALLGEGSNMPHRWLEGYTPEWLDSVPCAYSEQVAEKALRYHMNVALPLYATVEGLIRNVTIFFNREGKEIGRYFKAHLPLTEQALGFVPGDAIPVFHLDFGTVGVMTCMDIEYPEHALCLMLQGAELLCFPHVQGSWGEIKWEMRYRARATDTGCFVVSASYGHKPGDFMPGKMLGRSGIVGPDGFILAEAGREATVVTREIDLDTGRLSYFHTGWNADRKLQIAASRRPDLYGILVDTSIPARALELARATQEKPDGVPL
jgi:predicted amidohydrolase